MEKKFGARVSQGLLRFFPLSTFHVDIQLFSFVENPIKTLLYSLFQGNCWKFVMKITHQRDLYENAIDDESYIYLYRTLIADIHIKVIDT